MRVGSLFAGVGGFDLAAERAGMEVVWQSENDRHASAVLDEHWPDIPNYGDIHDITNPPPVDVLVGGFPCQDYSVAGKRDGLAGDRGALWWEFHRLIDEGRPRWVVGENVPGLLSSRGGRDFATIVDSLTELGYRVAWRVLDAQYFGVAQRRRRVFIVGHLGDKSPAEVLALTEGLSGHPPPSRQERNVIAVHATQSPITASDRAHALGSESQQAVLMRQREGKPGGLATPQVRRLTPLECERLQGFPDNWTESQSDTQRYKTMGNAVAVPVAEWIMQRLAKEDRR